MFEVIPLGTGSALPSKENHFSATAVETEQGLFLFDCGEGTQHRLLEASLRWSRLKAICITHLHGDHYFGLPGLLSTLSLLRHEKPLLIAGPAGIQSFVESIPSRIPGDTRSFEITFFELDEKAGSEIVFSSDYCRIIAHPIQHSIPSFGYRFEEADTPGNLDADKARALGVDDFADFRRLKQGEAVALADGSLLNPGDVVSERKPGATFAYITDTRPCDGSLILARDAELLYHEATFMEADLERAVKTNHTTALEAARIARDAGVDKLIIGHFSGRYDDAVALEKEAQSVFKNTEAAGELKRYILTGGEPVVEEAISIAGTD